MQKLKFQTRKLNRRSFFSERNALKKNLYHHTDGIVTSYNPSTTQIHNKIFLVK